MHLYHSSDFIAYKVFDVGMIYIAMIIIKITKFEKDN